MTMTTNPREAAPPALIIERTFDAPRELVWKAWSEPELFARWWGPKDYTCPVCKIDFRVGGAFLACMRSSDGSDIWGTGVYREIVPPERIVCTDSFADAEGNVVPASHYGMGEDLPLEMLLTVTFEEADGKTKLTIRHDGMPRAMAESANEGWNQFLDKLADSLAGA